MMWNVPTFLPALAPSLDGRPYVTAPWPLFKVSARPAMRNTIPFEMSHRGDSLQSVRGMYRTTSNGGERGVTLVMPLEMPPFTFDARVC